jgi:hypothetical protein
MPRTSTLTDVMRLLTSSYRLRSPKVRPSTSAGRGEDSGYIGSTAHHCYDGKTRRVESVFGTGRGVKKNVTPPNAPDFIIEQQPEIEIWESEGAKGDEVDVTESKEEQATLGGESAALVVVEDKVEDVLMA